MRLLALLGLGLAAAAAAAAPSRLLLARGVWAAFDRGPSCEAVAKPLLPPRGRDLAPYVAIAFDRAGPRHGQLFVQLRRPVRPGSSILLLVDDQPFLLVGRGSSGWSRDASQEAAVIAAMRLHGGMRVQARDSAGRRLTDRYLLDGAPAAIDAAAAACGLRR